MKTRRNGAFTQPDLLIVLSTLVLCAILLPILARPKRPICAANCPSNLRQIGLAFRMWANDHEEKFPMQLTAAQGGTKELVLQGLPLETFANISNELNNPRPLHCPQDNERTRATDFAQLAITNVSYFLVDGSIANPAAIIAGDRNICIEGGLAKGLVQITSPGLAAWGVGLHKNQGNLLLADGSAHQVTDQLLQKQLIATGLVTNRFAIP